MKIESFKINDYGNLHNIEKILGKNINIIQGKNESGKSTLLKFIINSFYGTSKNKKGKKISDYEKYKPWNGKLFSGKLKYILDNGESFEIYREFNKKNIKLYNASYTDVSKQFNIDKNRGNEFFYNQTKIDEELFLSTSAILQQEVKIEKNKQTILIQKIANMVGTGDDNVSYKRAMERINKVQLEEVGTERTREKPINVINKKIQKVKNDINNLQDFEYEKYKIENKKRELSTELYNEELKLEVLNEVKKINDKFEIEKEKIRIQENLKNNSEKNIKNIENELKKLKNGIKNQKMETQKLENEKNKKINKKNIKKIVFISLLLIISNIIQFAFIKELKFNFLLCSLSVVICGVLVYITTKKNQEIEENHIENNVHTDAINNLKNKLIVYEQNKKMYEKEVKKLKEKYNLEYNLKKEKIKNNFLNKFNIEKKFDNKKDNLNNYFDKNILENELTNLINIERVEPILDNLQKSINNKRINIQTLDIKRESIESNLELKLNLEEELSILKEKYKNLQTLNNSINLAKEVLELSYEKMKENVTPKFTENLSLNVSKITNGKYTNVKYNDEEGLIVETENGNYVSAEKLSIGTIDQLYLSLRLSIIKELTEETVPIFLDEAFAYYDDERLENILKYLDSEFKQSQIIIFTCTTREKDLLERLHIDYELIEL